MNTNLKNYNHKQKGFTLIELMVVVAIVGIIASMAVPKVSQMIRRSNEAVTKHKLGAIRAALNIYYADTEGVFPSNMDPLMLPGSKYLTAVLPIYTVEHGYKNIIGYDSSVNAIADDGGWGYVNSGEQKGTLWIQCTHVNSYGEIWSQN